MKRYELSDAQWERIAPLLLGKVGDLGRRGSNHWLFLVLRSGEHWQDLPGRYGEWKTAHKRFTRWAKAGGWERIFEVLARPRQSVSDARQHRGESVPAGSQQKGGCDQALGRARGGLTSKIHGLTDAARRPRILLISPDNLSNMTMAPALIEQAAGRFDRLIADRGYDSHAILDHVEASGARPIIPQRTCMPRRRDFNPGAYRLRNRIERTIGKLKQLRRVATRYDRLPQNYLATLYLAAIPFSCGMSIQPRARYLALRRRPLEAPAPTPLCAADRTGPVPTD